MTWFRMHWADCIRILLGIDRDDEGKPFVLPSVKEAERRVAVALASGESDKEYLPIEGDARFCSLSARLVFGTHRP